MRQTIRALAALSLLAAASANAAPTQISDGTSNTLLVGEVLRPGDIFPPPVGVVEPGTPEPEPAPPQASLEGGFKLRAGGATRLGSFPVTLSFDTNSATFSLIDDGGALFTGHLIEKGSKGKRFTLFFDGASRDAFAAKLAAAGAVLAGQPAGSVLGETLNLQLTLGEASASLKVKCSVLTSGIGEVGFKANVSGDISL